MSALGEDGGAGLLLNDPARSELGASSAKRRFSAGSWRNG
jgi:hypothetical protein